MTQYNGNISSLIQGVSQQARRERRPEQLESQENCISDITKGLGKRPGTALLNYNQQVVASDADVQEAAKHTFSTGPTDSETWTLFTKGFTMYIQNMATGITEVVDTTTYSTYLQRAENLGMLSKDYLRFFSIAGTTFVTNTEVEPTMSNPDVKPGMQAILYMPIAAYGQDYTIRVLGSGAYVAIHGTPSIISLAITSTTQEVSKPTKLISGDEMYIFMGNSTPGSETNVYLHAVTFNLDLAYAAKGNVAVLTPTGSTVLFKEYETTTDKTDFKVINFSTPNYDDLPLKCKDGIKVKITGVDKDADNDYYVKFVGETVGTHDIAVGHWEECEGWDEPRTIDAVNMPHKIVNVAGTWTLLPGDWVDRKAGDEISNPSPSFIGTPIRDVTLFQERLVMLNGESAVGSVAFDQFNFFADSVRKTSSDDPVDSTSSDNEITKLDYAMVYNGSLMMFSEKAQFIHPEGQTFTASNFSLASKSQYQTDIDCKPEASANSIFFPYKFGTFTGIREFRINDITGGVKADSITEHVSKYILGPCQQIVSSTDYNILAVRTLGDLNAIYLYEWFDQSDERKQAAWHKWEFPYEVFYIKIVREKLFIWFKWGDDHTSGIYILDLADRNTDELNYPVRLDHLIDVIPADSGDFYTLDVDLTGMPVFNYDEARVIVTENGDGSGFRVPFTYNDTLNEIYVQKDDLPNNEVGINFLVGLEYYSSAVITNPYVRDYRGVPLTKTKTALKTIKVNCEDTGELSVRITKEHAPDFEYNWSSRLVNTYLLDREPEMLDAEISVPIRTDANKCSIELFSRSHLPFYISDIDWVGKYREVGRRTI